MDEIVSRPFLLTFHKNNAILNLKSVKKAHWDEHGEPSPVQSSGAEKQKISLGEFSMMCAVVLSVLIMQFKVIYRF